MQNYSIFLGFLIFFSTSHRHSYCQNSDNQLFIIKNVKEYLTWHNPASTKLLVPLNNYVVPFYYEVPYQTPNNFTGEALYKNHKFYIAEEAAVKLKKVQDSLIKKGLSLYFFDTYRPYSVTKRMWEIIPDERYAANPKNGSGHNRGAAVDLSLADVKTGKPLAMPTSFDNFTDSAHHSFLGLPKEWEANRELLKGVMQFYGFKPLETEWWHYSLPNAKEYPILDLTFKDLDIIFKKLGSQNP